jgi:hypothetical protein
MFIHPTPDKNQNSGERYKNFVNIASLRKHLAVVFVFNVLFVKILEINNLFANYSLKSVLKIKESSE